VRRARCLYIAQALLRRAALVANFTSLVRFGKEPACGCWCEWSWHAVRPKMGHRRSALSDYKRGGSAGMRAPHAAHRRSCGVRSLGDGEGRGERSVNRTGGR
jgi:hypothetical protein